jgi:hypothetical protein
MTASWSWSARRTSAMRLLALLALSACGTEPLTSPTAQAPSFARGGGSGPSVKSADPDSGFRNTTIDVRVLGSGFDNGSKAVWALAGDTTFATTRITTNSTRFVSSGELVANITIASDAQLAAFDIQVMTASSKKGIGIELFTVQETGRWSAVFDDAAGNKLRSDNGTGYTDGGPDYTANCVLSTGMNAGGGVYQLRTIAGTDFCKAVVRPGWRYFKVDFGAPVVDLDQDGVVEAIEDAPGRLLAPDAFASRATATSVRILIFVVNPDGSTTWDTKYTLYLQEVAVSSPGGPARILQASGSSAAAALYLGYTDPARSSPNRTPTPLATVQLPFKLTVAPMP